jgi:hypothetical protein
MEQHTLVPNKTLLNNHTYYSLIPSSKWLSRLYSQQQNLVLGAVVSSQGQSKKLIASHTATDDDCP